MPSADQGPYNGRPKTKPSQVKHGTHKGYKWHVRYDMPACELCLQANREYERARGARRTRRRKAIRKLYGATSGGKLDLTSAEIDEVYNMMRIVTQFEEGGRLDVEGEDL